MKENVSDFILPIGLLFLAWNALGKLFPETPKTPTSTAVTAECPRGKEYTRMFLEACDSNYIMKPFGSFPMDSCVCLSVPTAPAPAAPAPAAPAFDPIKAVIDTVTSILPKSSPFVENVPTERMCQQIWDTQKQWPSECILAGYPAPAIEPIPADISPFTGKPWSCVSPLQPGCSSWGY